MDLTLKTCDIVGGLGNQLFIIFATLAYGLNNTLSVSLPYSKYVGKRCTYWDNFFVNLKMLLKDEIYINTYNEPDFSYTELPAFKGPMKFVGYFQSEKYFKNKYEDLVCLIKLREQQKRVKDKYCFDYANSISMHFRLGDYKNLSNYHPILTYKYYENSLSYIKNIRNILYFCEEADDELVLETVKKLTAKFKGITFTKVGNSIPDYEQLLIMSLCRDNIIANSTFSWWGAYFNFNENKVICYPSTWFGPLGPKNTMDLCPENWIKILT